MTGIGIYNSDITHIHFEPTSECNARCPQCVRTFFTTLKTTPMLNIEEWTPNDLKSVLEHDFFKNVKTVFVNGNVGDIVMHSNPKDLLSIIIDKKYKCNINTNGSAQPVEFWQWLGTQKNVTVEFGIDGLEDTHHLYRRNTRYDIVLRNAKEFINAGGHAQWMMTVFKHNQHQINECKKLSKELGFKKFISRNSVRFNAKKVSVVDKNFNHEYYLEPVNYSKLTCPEHLLKDKLHISPNNLQEKFNQTKIFNESTFIGPKEIDCKVSHNNTVFLSYDKRIWPCCFLGMAFYNNYGQNYDSLKYIFKNELDIDYNFNNVLKNDIFDIIHKFNLFKKIENSWNTECSHMCNSICSKKNSLVTQDIN